MEKGKIVTLEDRIPKLKQQRRKKANRRLILLLFLFFSLIAIVIYIQSPLSHIKDIAVKGNEFYSNNEIIKILGISQNTNIWKIRNKAISERLQRLPEIKKASVKIKWPNSIEINITEHKRIAYIKKGLEYRPVLENGSILENRTTDALPINAPIFIGFKEGSVLDELLLETKKLPEVVLNSISEIHYTPSKTDRYHISLFMNDGFEVSATIRSFSEKMSHYPSIISQLDPNKKGIIDLEVGSFFKAFEPKGEDTVEKKESTR